MNLSLYDCNRIIGKAFENVKSIDIVIEFGISYRVIWYIILKNSIYIDGEIIIKKVWRKLYIDRDECIILKFIRFFPKLIYKEIIDMYAFDYKRIIFKKILTKYSIANWKARKRFEFIKEYTVKRLTWYLNYKEWIIKE